jgi:hypothetical protein
MRLHNVRRDQVGATYRSAVMPALGFEFYLGKGGGSAIERDSLISSFITSQTLTLKFPYIKGEELKR